MRPMVDIYRVKRAVRQGAIEVFVNKGVIYISDAQSGECVALANADGERVMEESEDDTARS